MQLYLSLTPGMLFVFQMDVAGYDLMCRQLHRAAEAGAGLMGVRSEAARARNEVSA